jgi:hypothetical protein
MRFFSRLAKSGRECESDREVTDDRATYRSTLRIPSKSMPGVTFEIKRVSFGRRMELARSIREISQRAQYFEAGGELKEKIEASLLRQEIEATYLRWALVRVDGLTIDGEPVSADRLVEKGPEGLAREIVEAIKMQCGLTDDERKN